MDKYDLKAEFVAPRLWMDPHTVDGGFTSNSEEDREFAMWRAYRSIDIANALAIYFAERLGGEFKDTFITFSKNPQLVSVREGKTLREKLEIVDTYTEVANTNIEAVFELILISLLLSAF